MLKLFHNVQQLLEANSVTPAAKLLHEVQGEKICINRCALA